MITTIKHGGDGRPFNYMEFLCDSSSDLQNLPALGSDGCSAGSKAFLMDTQKTYILDNTGTWQEVTSSGGSSGGGIGQDQIASLDETKNFLDI